MSEKKKELIKEEYVRRALAYLLIAIGNEIDYIGAGVAPKPIESDRMGRLLLAWDKNVRDLLSGRDLDELVEEAKALRDAAVLKNMNIENKEPN